MRPGRTFRIARALVLTGLIAFAIFPLYTMLLASVTDTTEIQLGFKWLPSQVTLRPYVDMWSTIALLKYLWNSTLVAVVTTFFSILMGVLAAYAIVRYRFYGKRAILQSVIVTQTFPGIVFLLPLFILYVTVNRAFGITLVGSYLGLVVTYLSFSLPFCIWLLIGYLETIPVDTEEAAMTDGCGRLEAFLRITLPMAAPGILAVGVFTFLSAWSEVLFASVLTSEATRTVPIGFQLFKNGHGVVQWNQLMAASITVSVPIVVAFLWLQRYFVRGLSAGSHR